MMLAVILAAWTLWIWAPGVRHPETGAWTSNDTYFKVYNQPIQIPKEYKDEGHCKSALSARRAQGYLKPDVYGECLPSGTHPQ